MEIRNNQVQQVQWEAVVTRADGTVENLGVVSYWHRNPLRVLAWKISRLVKGK